MKRSQWARLFTRDTFSLIAGWVIIFYQMLYVPPKEVNEWFLLLAGSLIGVPGIAEVIALRGGRSTAVPPSPLPGEASSSRQSSLP